jgi:hypothetical protein
MLAAIAVVVLVANGLILVGYTNQVPGSAIPVPPPLVGAAERPSPTKAPEAGPPTPPPVGAPQPVQKPPAPAKPAPQHPVQPPSRPTATNHWPAWPNSIPNPDDFRGGRPDSPFAQRCRTGQIPASLCHGFPRGT